jgi:hypothetical protein
MDNDEPADHLEITDSEEPSREKWRMLIVESRHSASRKEQLDPSFARP